MTSTRHSLVAPLLPTAQTQPLLVGGARSLGIELVLKPEWAERGPLPLWWQELEKRHPAVGQTDMGEDTEADRVK